MRPLPKSTMKSPVITTAEQMKEKKIIKTKIGLGSIVKAQGREIEDNTSEVRNNNTTKYLVGCVQDVSGNNSLRVKYKDGQNEYMSSCSLVCLFLKQEVEKDDPLSSSTEK